MRYLLLLLLLIPSLALPDTRFSGSPSTINASSGTFTTELNIPNNGTLNVVGNSGKISFVGAATINVQNTVGDSVLSIGGTGTGIIFPAAASEIRFGGSDQVVLKRTGTAEMTVFTDNGTGGGRLLSAPFSRTKAQLDLITPPITGQQYWCSDCAATSKVVVSTGTTIAAFAVLNTTTKPN